MTFSPVRSMPRAATVELAGTTLLHWRESWGVVAGGVLWAMGVAAARV
jgi:hypothetical protein